MPARGRIRLGSPWVFGFRHGATLRGTKSSSEALTLRSIAGDNPSETAPGSA
jgi:hypothetical protein